MSVYKKKDKYYCRFQLNGERHHYLCGGATSVKEAEKIETQFKYKLQQQQNGVIPREEKQYKLSKLLDDYLIYSRNNKKSYKADICMVKIINSYFKDIYIKDINLMKLEQFKAYLINERKVTNATFNRYKAVLSKACNIAKANKLIRENPVRDLKKMKEKNFKIRFLTLDEEQRLMQTAHKMFSYLEDIIICALQTGMRRGEIFNLKWANIDFEYRFIELLETKSGKSRKIPISDKLMQVLKKIRNNSEYVFINPETNCPYTDIKHSFQRCLDIAKIENFRFHDLRHTVATRLVEKGIDLVVIKEILGHADISTTMRYAHAVPRRKLEAIAILNSYT